MIDTLDNLQRSLLGSKVNNKKTSSVVTIFAAVNSMVGSVILLIPVNYKDSGILFSTIAMAVIAFLSYKTCSWIVAVTKGQPDLDYIVRTYIGDNTYRLFAVSSSLILYGVGVVYFILLNTTLYQILTTIFYWSDFTNFARKDEFTFEKFSMQWQCIAIMAFVLPLFFVKKIELIIKIGRIGAISLYAYIALIIYLFFDNIAEGNLGSAQVKEIELFTSDIANILGNFATAFNVQNGISELMSNNKNPDNNPRDVKILYTIVALIYGVIGILGTFALQGRTTSVLHPQDLFDFFADSPGNIAIFVVAIVFFAHLFTVQPFFCFISKNQLKSIIFEQKEPHRLYEPIFNIIFTIICLCIVIFQVNPNIVIGLIGTIFGFVVVYHIPIRLRLKQNVILQGERQLDEFDHENSYTANTIEQEETYQTEPQNKEKQQLDPKKNKGLMIFIGFLIVFGLSLTIVQLLQIFGVL